MWMASRPSTDRSRGRPPRRAPACRRAPSRKEGGAGHGAAGRTGQGIGREKKKAADGCLCRVPVSRFRSGLAAHGTELLVELLDAGRRYQTISACRVPTDGSTPTCRPSSWWSAGEQAAGGYLDFVVPGGYRLSWRVLLVSKRPAMWADLGNSQLSVNKGLSAIGLPWTVWDRAVVVRAG